MKSMKQHCQSKMRLQGRSNYRSGKYAEWLARVFFRIKGYRIFAANYQAGRGTTAGEVDFIALKNHTVVFVEVKQRSSLENAAYAILPPQQQRIIRGAQAFLQKHPQFENYDQRFDAVLISLPCQIQHIENAWQLF